MKVIYTSIIERIFSTNKLKTHCDGFTMMTIPVLQSKMIQCSTKQSRAEQEHVLTFNVSSLPPTSSNFSVGFCSSGNFDFAEK